MRLWPLTKRFQIRYADEMLQSTFKVRSASALLPRTLTSLKKAHSVPALSRNRLILSAAHTLNVCPQPLLRFLRLLQKTRLPRQEFQAVILVKEVVIGTVKPRERKSQKSPR